MLLYFKIVEYVIFLYLSCYLYKLLSFFNPLYVTIINTYYVAIKNWILLYLYNYHLINEKTFINYYYHM